MRHSAKMRTATGLLLAAIALRAAIPIGYMPAAIGSGFVFEMCPSAVPAPLLAAIAAPDHSGAHETGHHEHHQGHAGESESSGTHFDESHCPVGQALSSLAIVTLDISITVPAVPAYWRPAAARRLVSTTDIPGHSRDPPA